MAGAGGEDWIYVLAEADEQAVVTADNVATDVGQASSKPSKNPEDADGETAAAEDEKKETNNADDNDDEDRWREEEPAEDWLYTPEEEIMEAWQAYTAGVTEEEEEEKEFPDLWYTAEDREIERAWEAYTAAVYRAVDRNTHADLQLDVDKALGALTAALERLDAARRDDESEVYRASMAYQVACERKRNPNAGATASSNGDDTYGANASSNGEDTYGGGAYPYYRGYDGGGSSLPASLGSAGGGYYDNRYSLDCFPGGAYRNPATGFGYGFGGYGLGFPGGAYPTGSGYGEQYPLAPGRYN